MDVTYDINNHKNNFQIKRLIWSIIAEEKKTVVNHLKSVKPLSNTLKIKMSNTRSLYFRFALFITS